MSRKLTETEAAQFEAQTNKCWQEAIDFYLKDFPASERECALLNRAVNLLKLPIAGMIFAVAMMKLHDAIREQTGEMLQLSDLQTEEEKNDGR